MSSLPLADCQIEIQRGLTTSSTAIFVPFTTQELFDNGKESLYYGLNALSNNLIMVDRKKLKNPNGLILGTPGSGKSFSAKREICNAFLVTDDDIIIADPEAEYTPLVERLHGQVIHISPASTQYINPMDINSNYSEEDKQKQELPCQRTVPPTTLGHRTYSPSSLSDSSLLNVAPTADSAAGVGVEVADCRSRAASCSGVTLAVRTISLTSAASAS